MNFDFSGNPGDENRLYERELNTTQMKKGRFSAELTEEDGSKVRVTVDAKDPEVSLGRFLTVLAELGATAGPPKDAGKLPTSGQENLTDTGFTYGKVGDELGSVMVQGTTQEVAASWTGGGSPSEDTKSKTNNVMVLMRSLPGGWFTSKDVRKFYEERFGVRVNLSTVSMYLGRLSTRGSLARARSGRSFKYRLSEAGR